MTTLRNMKGWLTTAAATLILAVGAAATGHLPSGVWAGPLGSVKPVVYHTASAPPGSPAEAERAIGNAKDLSIAFRVAADRVLPSLVTIETKTKRDASRDVSESLEREPFQGQNPFQGTPWDELFKDSPFFGKNFRFEMRPGNRMPQQGMGSGVIIDPSGLVLTNSHVVAGGKNVQVTVRLSDGREFQAASVWSDPKTDIALVKIDGAGDLVAANLADSDQVAVGDWVLALGQPFGLESTVTAGIIIATRRGVGINDRENYLQTDAAINPGNSGGPLVNLDGHVVGINTAISSRGGGNEGVGFAIPINLAKWVADQLKDGGTVRRAYLGVGIQPVTAALAEQFDVKPRAGVIVTDVFPDTPAAKAGLKSGDIIVDFAGIKVSSPQELQVVVERSELGKPHELEVVRDGKSLTLTFTPEEQPADYGTAKRRSGGSSQPEAESSSALQRLGLTIGNLDADVAEQLGLDADEGVVITEVESGSVAQQAGLESGMVITQINRQPVKHVDDVDAAMKDHDADKTLLLLVKSREGSRFVAIRP
jgi:serine protease Do